MGKRMGRRRKRVGVGVRVVQADIAVLASLSVSHSGGVASDEGGDVDGGDEAGGDDNGGRDKCKGAG